MLSADEARQLDRLALGSSSPAAAASSGLRHARARGAGLEFHDFRHYQPGDDLRQVAVPALNHRLILNFHGEMERVTATALVARLVSSLGTA